MKNKKAQFNITDTIKVLIFLIAFVIVTFVGYTMFTEWNNDIQTSDSLSSTNKAIVQDLYSRFPALFDGLFVFALVASWIFLIVTSFTAQNHPLLFVVAIIFSVIMLIVGAYLGNTYDELFTDDLFQATKDSFTMVNYFMSHMLEVILVFVASAIIAMYSGSRYQ